MIAQRVIDSESLETPGFEPAAPATALAVVASPVEMYRVATDAAGVCGEIVRRTARQIQRKKYVVIEGWQAIATAHGCVLSVESVGEDADGSVTSVASVRRISDGVMIARAEGFVGMDEDAWRDRARYARRAMAQTRAMSRAARSAFAHVVVLIDKGLSTTPAEEVPARGFDGDDGDDGRPAPRPQRQQQQRQQPRPAPAGPAPVVRPPAFERVVRARLEDRGLRGPEVETAVKGLAAAYEISDLNLLGRDMQAQCLRGIAQGHADKWKTMARAG